MKRALKFITTFALLLLVALSAVGCDFIVDNGGNSGGTETPSSSEPSSGFSVNVELKDSLDLSKGISYTKNSRDDKPYSSVEEVIKNTNIYRASVAINVILSDNRIITGSGTIIDIDDGIDYGDNEANIFYILTCHHVIDGCEGKDIKVYVPDAEFRQYDEQNYDSSYAFSGKIGGSVDRSLAVSLVGGDLESDVAVLRLFVEDDTIAANIVKAKIIDETNSVNKGEKVIAIGNAEGTHANWITDGLISKTNYVSSVENIGLMTLWGISADIYPGNSGGGLFNMYGELIGVTNSGESITDANGNSTSKGINFAIPYKISDTPSEDKGFLNVAKQLMGTYNQTNYGYISGRKENIGMTTTVSNGQVSVVSVTEGGAAYKAGVRSNDVITHAEVASIGIKESLTSTADLSRLIRSAKSVDTITLYVKRTVGGRVSDKEIAVSLSQYYFCNTGNYDNVKKAA